ncbi:MFS transporter [Halomonas cupida]|uniref:Drug resistance transporter, EmrB/QacA subfamily n=1 Tax=Halomonas cupida TaxID=44933 RepID=A0A1M7CUC4_9GAMM|nr:MDR family MFS transporter [Halomonas cupida]GEN25872.1 MFS transporter [Halomonas cupida]SHL70449.1 drug resistance transporter, EmrB/QacA subfamily [Halomonas cupida]
MPKESQHGSKVLISVLLGTFTVSLNNSALNLAIAELMNVFGASAVQVSWVVTLFLISMGMTMPLTGYLADRFARRRIYLIGLWLFLGGSLLGSLAQGLNGILLARGIQGIAAGLMIPLSLSLIFASYPNDKRGKVSGIWGFAVMIAPAIGPSVGGLLLEVSHWRMLFVMNLPFALAALICGHLYLERDKPNRQRRFDALGFVLVTLGMGAVLFSLGTTSSLDDLSRLDHAGPLLLGIGLLLAFVSVERRVAQPLLDLGLFAVSRYRTSVIIACVQAVITFGCILLVPLWMQHALGFSALATGLVFLPTAIAAACCSPLAGSMIDRYPPRWVVAGGLFITAASLIGMGLQSQLAPFWMVAGLMGLRGVGQGFAYLPSTTVGLNALPDTSLAQGAAMNNIARRLVSSLGVVVLSLYYDLRLTQGLAAGDSMAQASTLASQEAFLGLALLTACMIPLALTLRREQRQDAPSPAPCRTRP